MTPARNEKGELMQVTFLKDSKGRVTRKNYIVAKNHEISQPIILPKEVVCKTESCNNLREFYDLIKKNRDEWFRIYGIPTVKPGVATRRKKRVFPENVNGYPIIHIDFDGQPAFDSTSKLISWDPNSKKSVEVAVRDFLNARGIYFLDDVDIIVLLSSSQRANNTERMYFHVYFELERAVTLEEMTLLSKSVNEVTGSKLWDPAVYRPVQPDFITPPLFLSPKGQKIPDPIQERLFYFPGILAKVPSADFEAYKTEYYIKELHRGGFTQLYPGLNWKQILDSYAGKPMINEPCMMAAVRMVYEYGFEKVNKDREKYAKMLYDRAWQAIRSHGLRGNAADFQKYNMDKFRAYIDYPLSNPITKKIKTATNIDLELFENEVATMASGRLPKHGDKYLEMYGKMVNNAAYAIPMEAILKKYKITRSIQKAYKSYLLESGDKDKMPPHLKWLCKNLRVRYRGIHDTSTDEVYLFDRITKKLESVESQKVAQLVETCILKEVGSFQCRPLMESVVPTAIRERDNDIIDSEERIVGNRFMYKDNMVFWCINKDETCIVSLSTGVRRVKTDSQGLVWRHTEPEIYISDDHVSLMETVSYINDLFAFESKYDAFNIVSWLVTTLMPQPISLLLQIVGPPGSGKSELAGALKEILDPESKKKFNSLNRDPRHVFSILEKNDISVFDNMSSYLKRGVSDMFCTVLDGSGQSIRRLFSENERRFDKKRAIIITGLNSCIVQPDLIQRSLSISMLGHPKQSYKDFRRKFDLYLPKIRKGLLDLILDIMSLMEKTKHAYDGHREFIPAAVRYLAIKPKKFEQALASLKHSKEIDLVYEQPVLFGLLAFFQDSKEFEMTATRLYNKYIKWVTEHRGEEHTVYMTEYAVPVKDTVVLDNILNSPITFGRYLTKYMKIVNNMFNIRLTKESKNRRVYRLERLDLTNII